MMLLAAVHHIAGPHIDWAAMSPILALAGGGVVILLVGLFSAPVVRERVVPVTTIVTLLATIGLAIWRLHHPASIVSGALRIDDLSLELTMLFSGAAIAAVLLSWRALAPREAGHGEYDALLVFCVMGMAVFVSAQDLITLFLGIELLSIPLYILCASETRREGALESGLKYLVIGSVGSATLAYGLALIYGATGATAFDAIAAVLSQGKLAGGGTALLFTGLGLVIVGFAFKSSVAPFHQWTPDVYEGAPTPITTFMATATKAAGLGVFLRFFDVAAIGAQDTWAPLLASLAAITMIVGNVGALGQSSLKRMLGYSGVAQAGYMLSGVVVGTQLGIQATVLYLFAYLGMNLAPFAVIVAVERERPEIGDDIAGLAGLATRVPMLAWAMTIGMLGLAGIPGTVGFIGKFQLIHALVDGDYTWLAIVLVIGSMISLGYYLRVIATMWMRPALAAGHVRTEAGLAPIAGASPEADEPPPPAPAQGEQDIRVPVPGEVPEPPPPSEVTVGPVRVVQPEVAFVALLFAGATIFFGIFPSPLFDFAAHAGHAIAGLF